MRHAHLHPHHSVWHDEPEPDYPTLTDSVAVDVCVIGLGGSGLTCIHELLELGVRVAGIDATTVGGGAAGRNGGFLLAGLAAFYHDAVTAIGREQAAAIYRLTIAEIERMAAAMPGVVRQVGSLRIAASAEEIADCAAQLQAMRADDLPVEPYRGPEGEGLLLPTDGAFQPLQRCRLLAEQARRGGALLFTHTPALAIDDTIVRCPQGQIHARHVIVAVDGGLEQLLPELRGVVRTTRLQMLATAPDPERTIPRPVYTRWGYDYWQQLPDGRIALGGCRDRFAADEWEAPAEPSAPVQAALEQILQERIGSRTPIERRWAARVAFHVGSVLPIARQVHSHVWAIGAYNGTGNVIGALCGRAAARAAVRGDVTLMRLLDGTARG
ncbi:NAD(P)/FAD-dependent oxidoreductase [Chloroflexus aggregans]|uniref:FAD dependent oxidoreductase n=1 Tax=Chloroflexus aggregans (strain MD-66 / DSM 9485) TaxID=326427 RepID=B8G301_CHLAD|nr:FAD-binding oxidoreductase [Chloroflexus aggregans]ACL23305.1 FAD dependent oxidoreductase [Chloroflexus aggregans DSM 9485]